MSAAFVVLFVLAFSMGWMHAQAAASSRIRRAVDKWTPQTTRECDIEISVLEAVWPEWIYRAAGSLGDNHDRQ